MTAGPPPLWTLVGPKCGCCDTVLRCAGWIVRHCWDGLVASSRCCCILLCCGEAADFGYLALTCRMRDNEPAAKGHPRYVR